MNNRLYHLVLVRDDKRVVRLTCYPMTHECCMAMKSKFSSAQQASITVTESRK